MTDNLLAIFGGLNLDLRKAKIETESGKYKCKNCGNLYVPKYSAVYFAPHLGRTRYMTCPKCHKKSWQKKIA